MPKVHSEAWKPLEYSKADRSLVAAVKNLSQGKASEQQQRDAWDFIIHIVAGVTDLSFRSGVHGGERDTSFFEGRRYSGLQLLKLANTPTAKLIGEETKADNG